jgi:hypothetical protein
MIYKCYIINDDIYIDLNNKNSKDFNGYINFKYINSYNNVDKYYVNYYKNNIKDNTKCFIIDIEYLLYYNLDNINQDNTIIINNNNNKIENFTINPIKFIDLNNTYYIFSKIYYDYLLSDDIINKIKNIIFHCRIIYILNKYDKITFNKNSNINNIIYDKNTIPENDFKYYFAELPDNIGLDINITLSEEYNLNEEQYKLFEMLNNKIINIEREINNLNNRINLINNNNLIISQNIKNNDYIYKKYYIIMFIFIFFILNINIK